jgi:3-oxoacyl-[acyl-carrier protein] reductase
MGELSGKVALVTGGSRGIGAGIARRLAREGADVAITYLSNVQRADEVVADIEGEGRRGLALGADAGDPQAVARAVEQTVATLGRLDVLVNNAGVLHAGPLDEITLEQVDATLAIHVRGAFLTTQAAVPHMGPGGRVITIGSNLAERVTDPGLTLYAMSKSALTGFTRGLARDLGASGITANVVHPGSTDTDMNPADGAHSEAERAVIALGSYGAVDDVAATVAYLAGEGGRHVTGTSILVDGGANA